MQDFKLYFSLGTEHILSWDALDHILFVTALCLRYLIHDWKKVVIMVTAFTIGHSLTLALSALNMVNFPARWIEFLVPVTIAITAVSNLLQKNFEFRQPLPVIYFFALFFGLIHGMAFAGQFKAMEGREGLVAHLLAFNIGIELAQLLIVAGVLTAATLLVQLARLPRKIWLYGLSLIIFVFAIKLSIERFPL